MLKDKEVVSDPERQYEIARQTHAMGQHAGINKTTATITERYHWRGIKDTVSDVIRVCAECEDKSNMGLMKPSTPNQTLFPQPPVSVPSVSAANSPEAIRHQTPQPGQSLHPQKSTPSGLASISHNEPPIDPQLITQQHPDQPIYAKHSGLYESSQRSPQNPYFNPQTDLSVDTEDHALLHLLNASNSTYDEETCQISDQDLEMMLTRQLEEEADTGGTSMDVDSLAGLSSGR